MEKLQLKANREELLNSLKIANRATTKSTIAAWEKVLLTLSKNGKLIAKGTSQKMTITKMIADGTADEGFKLAVDAGLLIRVLTSATNENVTITTNSNNDSAKMVCGSVKMELPIYDLNSWTELEPPRNNGEPATVDMDAIKSVLHAYDASSSNIIKTSIQIKMSNGSVQSVACDGYRIASRGSVDTSDYVLVHGSNMKIACDILSEKAIVIVGEDRIAFSHKSVGVVMKTLEGSFFNTENILQATKNLCTTKISFDRDSLIRSLTMLNAVDSRLKMDIDKKKCIGTVKGKNIKSTLVDTLAESDSIETTVDKLTIGISIDYLLDSLKSINEEKITLFLAKDNQPLAFYGDNYVECILPILIKS